MFAFSSTGLLVGYNLTPISLGTVTAPSVDRRLLRRDDLEFGPTEFTFVGLLLKYSMLPIITTRSFLYASAAFFKEYMQAHATTKNRTANTPTITINGFSIVILI